MTKPPVQDLQGIQIKCKRGRRRGLFDSDDALSHHLTQFHAKGIKKKFCCYLCKKSLVSEQSLEWHMHSQHTGQSQFECSFANCFQKFVHKGHLQQHTSTVHTKKGHLKCPKCRETFFYRNVLKMHLANQHDIGISFRCHLCKKSLINQQSLQWHMNSQHTGQSLLRCPFAKCSQTFVHKGHLQKHTKSMHAKWVASKETKYPKKALAMVITTRTVLKHPFNKNSNQKNLQKKQNSLLEFCKYSEWFSLFAVMFLAKARQSVRCE